MKNLAQSFAGPTSPGWRKVRNIGLLVSAVLTWFINAANTTPALGIPETVIVWSGFILGFVTLLVVYAQSQGVTTDKKTT